MGSRARPYADVEIYGPSALKTWVDFTKYEKGFVEAYCTNGMNMTGAFRDSGYSTNLTDREMYQNARQVMSRPHIQHEVKKRLRLFEISQEEMMARHSSVARGDIGDILVDHEVKCPECEAVVHAAGDMRVSLKLAQEKGVSHLIKKVTQHPNGKLVVELYEADKARTDLMRANGTFRKADENIVTGMADLIQKAIAAQASQPPDAVIEEEEDEDEEDAIEIPYVLVDE
jgi:hypothetical protein